ncbi:hypothetical protein OPQ81_011851 [Rhizoctonia solani]|nr:hypothetical protein OPQ81_011851 [Rhizoctonia solani]
MLLVSYVVPALFAAASLVKTASIPRGDDFFTGLIDALNKRNLTALADSYGKVAQTKNGEPVFDMLENGGPITLLAPDNCAFEPDFPQLDSEALLYNAIWGSIDKGFDSNVALTRRSGAAQSRSIAPSGAGISGGGIRKTRANNYQVQVIDSGPSPGTRKRTSGTLIEIDRAVGSAKVVDRFEYKNIIVLVIDTILSLPGKVSDLLCKPLIKDAPDGFSKFAGGLQKVGLLDDVNEGKLLTAFVPVDESLGDINKLSKDDLSCLLKNHFFFGKRVFSPLFEKIGKATAASGKELEFSFENGIHYVCCGKSKATVIRSDITSGNGILHIIDRPLKCD